MMPLLDSASPPIGVRRSGLAKASALSKFAEAHLSKFAEANLSKFAEANLSKFAEANLSTESLGSARNIACDMGLKVESEIVPIYTARRARAKVEEAEYRDSSRLKIKRGTHGYIRNGASRTVHVSGLASAPATVTAGGSLPAKLASEIEKSIQKLLPDVKINALRNGTTTIRVAAGCEDATTNPALCKTPAIAYKTSAGVSKTSAGVSKTSVGVSKNPRALCKTPDEVCKTGMPFSATIQFTSHLQSSMTPAPLLTQPRSSSVKCTPSKVSGAISSKSAGGVLSKNDISVSVDDESDDWIPNNLEDHTEISAADMAEKCLASEPWGWRDRSTESALIWLARVLVLLDHGKHPCVIPSESKTCTAPSARTELVFASRLRRIATMSVAARSKHFQSRREMRYCDPSCPMSDCFIYHHRDHATAHLPFAKGDEPDTKIIPNVVKGENVMQEGFHCENADCPQRFADCPCCADICHRESLARAHSSMCLDCGVSVYCSKWCLDSQKTEHRSPRPIEHPLPHPSLSGSDSSGRTKLLMIAGASECMKLSAAADLFTKNLECESLRLIQRHCVQSLCVQSPCVQSPCMTDRRPADCELKEALRHRFVMIGTMPLLMVSHYLEQRLASLRSATSPRSSLNAVDDSAPDGGHGGEMLMLRTMVVDRDPRLDQLVAYLAVERFLETHFSNHTLFYRCCQTKAEDPSLSCNDGKYGDGMVTSESTLRIFSGSARTRAVQCVGCQRPAPSRSQLYVCSMCTLATCCQNCAPDFHNPSRCGYISSLLEFALTNSLQFSPYFTP
jgi:hypothetical protein